MVHKIQTVCHRGANEYAPENTYAAAKLCIDWGMDYVEIDVSTSKDEVLYLLHGPDVDRTTNGTGRIAEFDSVQIDVLDAGSWFDSSFSDERVPRLVPFLRWIKGQAKVYFDLKFADIQNVIEHVYDIGLEKDCFFWFRNNESALELRRLAPDFPLKINVDCLDDVIVAHEQYGAQIIEIRLDKMSEEIQDLCRELGIKVMIYHKEKDPEAFRQILEWKVDLVNLNHGDVFARVADDFYESE